MIYLLCSSHQSPCTSNLCVREIHPGLKPSAEGSKWINPHFLFDALGVSHFLCHPNLKYRENRQNVECDQDLEKKNLSLCCYLLFAQIILLTIGPSSSLPFSHQPLSSFELSASFFLPLSLSFPISFRSWQCTHTHAVKQDPKPPSRQSTLSLSHTPPSYLSLCWVYFFGFGNARFSKRTSLLLEENKLKLHFHL